MSELEGRLEVCNSNRWGTICDDAWDFRDSNVACGQLGFSNAGEMDAYTVANYMATH